MFEPRKIVGYGWHPDIPDQRDIYYETPPPAQVTLPTSVDLRPQCPIESYDQLQLGSCTANAIACAIEFDELKQKYKRTYTPSRLFIYYNERVLEGDPDHDSGAQLRDGLKAVNRLGWVPEREWPYEISEFAVKPSARVYQNATTRLIKQYSRVIQHPYYMKYCLYEGYPFVFGFTVYESFESLEVASTGKVPMPGSREYMMGGHAVMAVGYDDTIGRFICRNSWGGNWGMRGYFTMPYDYLSNPDISADFWTIRLI